MNSDSTEEPTKSNCTLESSHYDVAHDNKDALLLQNYVKVNVNERTEELNNLINNPSTTYIGLQENFNHLLTQKQKIEQLEKKTKEIENIKQLIESKENDIKKLEEINTNLKEQASKYQSALGAATTYQLGDDDKNNSVRLNEDIARLQDTLDDYVTNLRPKMYIDYGRVNNLFAKYQCDLKIKFQIEDVPLIKALLQRHVIAIIYEAATKYFNDKDTGKPNLLELEIDSRVTELINLADIFAKTRFGSDSVTSAVPIKIRQQIFAALSNYGFSDIVDDKEAKSEHNFINQFKNQLNEEMESYRKILDLKKKKEVEDKAADIIREVVRLFFFRLKTQEPIAMWKWFDNNDRIDPMQMTGSWDEEEIEDATVEICIFPLIYRYYDSSTSNLQIYTPAKVFIRDKYSSSSEEEISKSDTRWWHYFIPFWPF